MPSNNPGPTQHQGNKASDVAVDERRVKPLSVKRPKLHWNRFVSPSGLQPYCWICFGYQESSESFRCTIDSISTKRITKLSPFSDAVFHSGAYFAELIDKSTVHWPSTKSVILWRLKTQSVIIFVETAPQRRINDNTLIPSSKKISNSVGIRTDSPYCLGQATT